MIILDGKKVAEKSNLEIKNKVENLKAQTGRSPFLAAILVGDDKASETYVSMKEKTCHRLGLESKSFKLPESSSTEDVLGLIRELNKNANVDGILLQHPVPKQVDEIKCFNEIVLDKDVDGVNTHGYGNMAMGIEAFHSCTPFGIMRLLDAYKVDCAGKLAIVVGRSQILGKPMSAMLLNSNATVLTAHSKTENLNELISMGDIIVAAVGKPKFIKANNLKKDSILIDAGYHPELNCGDVDMEGIEKIVSGYTPVPGGVGPMTINSLILNTVKSMEKRING